MMKRAGAVLCLLAVIAPCLRAEDDPRARIESFITAEMARSQIPGLALAVVKDSRVVMARGFGLANVEHQVPVGTDTVFQSGSMGKQFTATAVMLLAEDGKLSLDDPVERFLAPVPESWRGITVRHLLSHTSGMQDYPDSYDLRRDYTEDELLAMVKSVPLASAPGERWSYSNLGFVSLGILIGKVSGRFYGDYLADRIFKPLGMSSSRVISEADIVPHRAAGYRLVDGQLKNQAWVSPSVNTTADGSLYLTLDDMLKWEAGLAAGRPLGQAGLARMWTPAPLSGGRTAPYGFGWFTIASGGRRIVFHGGAWQGFKSFIARFPDDGLTVILFANLWDTNEWRIARGVAAACIPQLALGTTPVAAPDPEPAVRGLARKVLRQIWTGTVDGQLFTPEARGELSADRLARLRERIDALSLPPALIASLELLGRSEDKGLKTYRYALIDLTATEVFTLRLTPDGKVAGVDLRQE